MTTKEETVEWTELKHIGTSVYPKNTDENDYDFEAELLELERELNLDKIHGLDDMCVEDFDNAQASDAQACQEYLNTGHSSKEILTLLINCGMSAGELRCTCGGGMKECAAYHPKNGYTKKLIYWKCTDCHSMIGDYPMKS